MATTHQFSIDLVRSVAWTHCENGPLDLRPETAADNAGYLDASIDFEAQSFHPMPTEGEPIPCWSPGYVEHATHAVATIRADLMAVTMAGITAHEVQGWLIKHNIAGMVWPTTANTQLRPTCCMTILLNRTVHEEAYKQVFQKLARDVFAECIDPTQADCRYRFDYPRTPNDQSQLLRHNGHAFPVDYAISLDVITSEAIADYAATQAVYIQE